MLNPDQIGRIADAVVAIRHDWNAGQVADYLEANHATRPFAVLAAAAVYVAAEPKANNLTALEIAGIWWITPANQSQQRGAAPVVTDAAGHKIGPKRDEAWWAKFEASQAQRSVAFGYPKQLEAEQ